MPGSSNAQDLANLVNVVTNSGGIIGNPGSWVLSVPHATLGAKGISAATTVMVQHIPALQKAIEKSNDAAAKIPGAGSGTPVTSNTATSVIDNAAKVWTSVASTPQDVKTLETGAKATLHWWGWEVQLEENATKALENLLTKDLAGLLGTATSLGLAIPVLAAVAGIIEGVTDGLEAWISSADSDSKGVVIDGYLWIGVWVTSN